MKWCILFQKIIDFFRNIEYDNYNGQQRYCIEESPQELPDYIEVDDLQFVLHILEIKACETDA